MVSKRFWQSSGGVGEFSLADARSDRNAATSTAVCVRREVPPGDVSHCHGCGYGLAKTGCPRATMTAKTRRRRLETVKKPHFSGISTCYRDLLSGGSVSNHPAARHPHPRPRILPPLPHTLTERRTLWQHSSGLPSWQRSASGSTSPANAMAAARATTWAFVVGVVAIVDATIPEMSIAENFFV